MEKPGIEVLISVTMIRLYIEISRIEKPLRSYKHTNPKSLEKKWEDGNKQNGSKSTREDRSKALIKETICTLGCEVGVKESEGNQMDAHISSCHLLLY